MNFTTEDILYSIKKNRELDSKERFIVKLYVDKVNRKGKKGNIITVYDILEKKYIYRVFCSDNRIESNLIYVRNYYGKVKCKFPTEVEDKYFNDSRTESSNND